MSTSQRQSHESLMQRSGAPSKFIMDGLPTEFRKVIAVGAKLSGAGSRGARDPSVVEFERRLGVSSDSSEMKERVDVAQMLETRDRVQQRGTSAGGVVMGSDAAQQHRLRAATGHDAEGQESSTGVVIQNPRAKERFDEIVHKMRALASAPVQPKPVYVFGTPPERRENPDAFRFTVYVMPEGAVRGRPLDANCNRLLHFIDRNCPSIRDLMYVQDITSLKSVPAWLREVPALMDRDSSEVFIGANARAFVDQAITREKKTTEAYVSYAMRERDQLMRTYRAEADQIVARYAVNREEGGGGGGGGGGAPEDDEPFMEKPDDEEDLLQVFEGGDEVDLLDPSNFDALSRQLPGVVSSRGGQGSTPYDTSLLAERQVPGGMRSSRSQKPPSAGPARMISGLDVSSINLNFRK